jgi:hypothetical protein
MNGTLVEAHSCNHTQICVVPQQCFIPTLRHDGLFGFLVEFDYSKVTGESLKSWCRITIDSAHHSESVSIKRYPEPISLGALRLRPGTPGCGGVRTDPELNECLMGVF